MAITLCSCCKFFVKYCEKQRSTSNVDYVYMLDYLNNVVVTASATTILTLSIERFACRLHVLTRCLCPLAECVKK